ncbi:hypothetical protein TNCV_337041 [Trichonephila clavipes]|nr:hypothetical protein TNCV_337041 [Trichonephila clavipes]
MTLNSYKAFGGNKCRLFTIRFVYFFIYANNQIEIHGRKEHGTFQTVERIVNTRQRDKRLFRDAIQLCDNRRKNANYRLFFTSTMGDDQGLSEGWTIPSSSIF